MAAVNGKGEVMTWGDGSKGQLGHPFEPSNQHGGAHVHPDIPVPRLVKGLENILVVSVACGKSHTVALTRDGALYGWGATVAGQAGFENDGYIVYTPRKIEELRSKIVAIAGFHRFVLALGRVSFYSFLLIKFLSFPIHGSIAA